MNYYIEKFIKEHNKEHNKDGYIYIMNYCVKYFDDPRRISEIIISDLNKVYDRHYKKDLPVPFKKMDENIKKFISVENDEKISKNRFENQIISNIQINNFKGFKCVSQGDSGTYIELHNKKNIFFGANGSGKTSFCEALEYKLTGSIKEAKKRGIKDKEYIENSSGGKETISVNFKTSGLLLADISEYERSEFNKCFIEKNRINEFALLRGHKDTGVKANDVTARLLGFEVFDDFKSKFVQAKQFETRINNLFAKKSTQELKDLYTRNETYISQYNTNINKINKNEYHSLLNKEQEVLINTYILDKVNSRIKHNNHKAYFKKDVLSWLWKLKLNFRRLDIIDSKLNDKSKELDLSELYKAVIKLKGNTDESICPACKTPLLNTIENPFDYANREILKLKEISLLKERKETISTLLATSYWEKVINFKRDYEYSFKRYKQLEDTELTIIIKKFDSVNDKVERLKILSNLFLVDNTIILSYLKKLNIEYNKDLRIDKIRNIIIKKQKELQEQYNYIAVEKSKYSTVFEQQKDLFLKISLYKKNSKKITKDVEQDKKYNEFLKDLVTSYAIFLEDLKIYIHKEQNELICKIKDRILGYYNIINKGDSHDEKILEIDFEEQSDKTYTIKLRRKDGWKKAGVILSEGHLRVLGLSIILSIAESSNIPFIVFDDVVNAIDSEHRANIIEMMFCNEYLNKTQLIVTTHDRLFWERFCNIYSTRINKLEKENVSACFKYSDNSIHYIRYSVSYEEKIANALEFHDIKQALVYLRIWFESICFDYCKRKGEKIEGKFSQTEKQNPTYLIVSIAKVYDTIIKKKFNKSKNLKIILEKLNWNFLNQEHHSFDENIFNVNHSTTSNEVQEIFDALKQFQQEVNESFVVA